MNNKDEKAFEDWYGDKPKNYASLYLQNKKAWQAACEYKKETLLECIHNYYSLMEELKEYKEAARSEAEEVNRLQAENKKLREALEFYAESWERGEWEGELLVRKLGSYNKFVEVHSIAREALKEAGEE